MGTTWATTTKRSVAKCPRPAALALGAQRLGVPIYGIVAGLGVGGLAIAMAAQPTVENLIGGLSLFADKPIRVGDVCRYGSDEGTIEAIGIRSTRIRGSDRALTTMPNTALSKMPLVSLSQRDQMLIQSVIHLRYETSSEQLCHLLIKIREALLGHPKIHPIASASGLSLSARLRSILNCSLMSGLRSGRNFLASAKRYSCRSWIS
jgi:small-conductance mechanosensitive channel